MGLARGSERSRVRAASEPLAEQEMNDRPNDQCHEEAEEAHYDEGERSVG